MKLNLVEMYKKIYISFFPKYILAGGINTLFCYGIYFLLTKAANFRIAYFVAFITGIIFSYLLNSTYVFQSTHTFKKGGLFLLLYVGQFILGFFTLNFLVILIKLNPLIAPLFVTLIIMPLTYLFTKTILNRNTKMTRS